MAKQFDFRGSVNNRYASEKSLIVLVDMDMVLCDFEQHLLNEFRRLFPEDERYIPLDQRKGFYAKSQYEKRGPDLPEKIMNIYNSEGFFLNLPEIPGACKALKDMNLMDGVEVYIVTSPLTNYQFCLKEKCQWIEKNLGQSWVEKLILTKDKTLVYGHLLIDDRPNVNGLLKAPSWKHIVFTACHNVRKSAGGKRRLENWTDGTWQDLILDFKKTI